ncbi:Archaeal DNA polymerase II, small subunit/DNA polymerase delta, subunit B [archaeon GW2011_AR15]|nr:Archaeal DNA polymerase II, small subunit/DNA polymerase delta, subunit B [archaeon GW2011_AR15]MBS3103903.1 metallophosphoesterase [Candidatus Woesearchaeota archaeon]
MRDKIKEYLEKGILVSPDMTEADLGNIPEKQEGQPATETTPIRKEDKKHPAHRRKVEVVKTYEEQSAKKDLMDFVNTYNSRYLLLQSILMGRRELEHAMSIRKCKTAQEGEQVSLIAMIMDVSVTKNDNVMLVLEDQTGTIKAVVTKNNKDLHTQAKDLTPDEVVGVGGMKGNDIIFLNTIVQPDVPLTKELKKSPDAEAAVFISDIHIGSQVFLRKEFEKFISWIRGETGDAAQKELVSKIKYLFIVGDLVEGIGIFPGQEKELEVEDIYGQYRQFSDYIKKIPEHITIILCPGNHDPVRIAEPQPELPSELIPELVSKENIILVSSPSIVNIGRTAAFSGIDILLYHGFSFPYYASSINSIRQAGGLEATENILKYLLKRRHLAPTHGSTQYQLGYDGDPLVIEDVPDILATGHVHRISVDTYRNVTLLNCSCWISQTKYQERRGLMPQPAWAIYIDLQTRKTTKINFESK